MGFDGSGFDGVSDWDVPASRNQGVDSYSVGAARPSTTYNESFDPDTLYEMRVERVPANGQASWKALATPAIRKALGDLAGDPENARLDGVFCVALQQAVVHAPGDFASALIHDCQLRSALASIIHGLFELA